MSLTLVYVSLIVLICAAQVFSLSNPGRKFRRGRAAVAKGTFIEADADTITTPDHPTAPQPPLAPARGRPAPIASPAPNTVPGPATPFVSPVSVAPTDVTGATTPVSHQNGNGGQVDDGDLDSVSRNLFGDDFDDNE